MKTYIALLRGINVSGHNIIKMDALKLSFIQLGFNEVVTYIQSGNVIFISEENNTSKIETTIIKAIKTKFGYDIKALVITKKELEITFNSNPFIKIHDVDVTKLCVTFLRNNPTLENVPQIEKLIANANDEFKITKKSIYLHCPTGFAKTKLTNNLFERKLKTDATPRNWRTITKLLELSNQ
ncbi:DUF1697 domain-containing protein [Lutibacter sp.]|uniref:DUF1697 domain-containing protein n=1 Tax=Lutibacter sp. TaxID=1925666 RepID=UPI0025BA4920|nr:DUF1697 domain-containing protein [Lutibacter sp.]MCF6167572.1 DUF1697 domain-containing protein [Lutibacter sp.]